MIQVYPKYPVSEVSQGVKYPKYPSIHALPGCAPIPLAAPNTHCGIERGYRTHDNGERDGVRGFGGSGVRGSIPAGLTHEMGSSALGKGC